MLENFFVVQVFADFITFLLVPHYPPLCHSKQSLAPLGLSRIGQMKGKITLGELQPEGFVLLRSKLNDVCLKLREKRTKLNFDNGKGEIQQAVS